ncbi:MAG: dihydrolipoamide acetyltransferase family protein [Candidatus Neomarinimicrobiota bacterium]|nr:diapophytoene dehydrogenase [Candidatus Neomarinimicrobiota bacterium]MBO61934.1 diapophytoene dehydrogenase [Candidatus Neomarinimicrobiota bacterium]MEC7848156.1 dihydrolipoamide acetyltransferase family protein [Candidatus Neomarinimicrobiota bacterium]|tara:strand:- start:3619 stop:4905 length:1287 start_codon:yes stop_codon:yes gene_type:complete
MVVDVIMPKMGESLTEGTILEWYKKPGETISQDETLLEIGTDKVDSEIPSPTAGTVVEILADVNAVIEVGVVIARIDTDGSTPVKSRPKEETKDIEKDEVSLSQQNSLPSSKRGNTKQKSNKGESIFTPVVLKIATQKNLSLSELDSIQGTGRNGRITKKDLHAYLGTRSPVPPTTIVKQELIKSAPTEIKSVPGKKEDIDHMRKLIAGHMRYSLDTSAHVHVMSEVDMTSIVDFVTENEKSFLEKEGLKLTYTPFIILATVQALKVFPEMNASLENGDTVIYHKQVNIGLAVSVDNGLMVPTLLQCDEKSLLGLCKDVNDIAVRTRSKKISPDELQGSTFTITNFGVFGAIIGTPIINQPNVGILGTGAIKKQPVVVEREYTESIAIRSIMMLTLGFDHRLIDGAGGARFIQEVKNNLETMKLGGLL